MIPSNNTLLNIGLEPTIQPSKTYRMNFEQKTIIGHCDGAEALLQAIYKILNTERYQYIIYSWNYGIELLDLYGKRVSFVCAELPRRIEEALLQDDRINSVDSFEFDISQKRIVIVTFTVHSIYGDINVEKAVNY